MFPVKGEHLNFQKATWSMVKSQKTQKTSKLRPAFKECTFFQIFKKIEKFINFQIP